MKAISLGSRVTLSFVVLAVALFIKTPGSLPSQAAEEGYLKPFSVPAQQYGPPWLGHIDWGGFVRSPCCDLPVTFPDDEIAFRSDLAAGVAIQIDGAQVHNRWIWRYYEPDGTLYSDVCFMDIRQPGEPGNNTSYVALVTNCGWYSGWQVLETFPGGCPCSPSNAWMLAPIISGGPLWSMRGIWDFDVDYTDDYTNPSGDTIPVTWGEMNLMSTPAVLLVHGWESDCSSVSTLQQNLASILAIPSDNLKCYDYDSREGVEAGAQHLKQNIEDFRQRLALLPDEEIDIVAHSMGGLVARYYRESRDENGNLLLYNPATDGPIGSITMLGTPNNGVWAADLADWICDYKHFGFLTCPVFDWATAKYFGVDLTSQAVVDMAPMSWVLRELNQGFTLPQWPDLPLYAAHAGTNHGPVGDVVSKSRNNDCLVAVSSVGGPNNIFDPLQYQVSHSEYLPFPGCGSPSLVDDMDVADHVAETIKGESILPDMPATAAPQSQTTGLLAGAGPMIGSAVDYVTPNASKTYTFTVPSGLGEASFVVYWLDSNTQEANLGVTLRRPSGQLVNPTDPDLAEQPQVTSNGPFYVLFSGYVMNAPVAGDWQVTVNGVSVPDQGQAFVVALMPLDSQVALGASASAPRVLQDQAEVITGAVFDGSSAIAPTSISAVVTTPSGDQEPVTLQDDGTGGDQVAGDQVYSGTFTSTTQCGGYAVTVNATASSSSEGTVTRQQFVTFQSQVIGDAVEIHATRTKMVMVFLMRLS